MEKYPGPQPSAEPGIRLRVTRPRLLILIVILVLVAGVWGWQEFRRRQERPAPELNIAPSTQTRVDPAPQPSGATSEPLRIMAVGAPVNRDAPALLNAGVSIKPSPRPPLTPASEVMVGALPQSAVKIPVAPVAALPSPPRSAENPPDVAPPSLGWVPEQPVVAVLQAPVVAPSLVKRETSVVSEAQILRRVEPRYPQLAVNNHMQGAVVLKAAILRTGEVGHIRLVKGNELLGRAAIEAVRQWRYKPEQLDGRPVEVDTTITIHFSLNR